MEKTSAQYKNSFKQIMKSFGNISNFFVQLNTEWKPPKCLSLIKQFLFTLIELTVSFRAKTFWLNGNNLANSK